MAEKESEKNISSKEEKASFSKDESFKGTVSSTASTQSSRQLSQADYREKEASSLASRFSLQNQASPKKGILGSILLMVFVIALSFYVGAAWQKNNISKISQKKEEGKISLLLKSLADPKSVFSIDPEKEKPQEVDFNVFWEAWKELDKKFIDEEKLDVQTRVQGAIRGMVKALGDPYTAYLDPNESREFGIEIEGSFEGIGAELGMKDEILTIIAPIKGMPAERAGIRSGDKIIKINGESTVDMTIEDAVKKIRGPKGTEVTLTILREGEDKTQDITIKRATIKITSVEYEKKEGGIGYVQLKRFGEETSKEFNKIAAMIVADGDKGIILDLRDNPGGLLDEAVKIISKFVPEGETVVWEEMKDGQREPIHAIGGNFLDNLPVVILINEGSASASEILAGALKDIKNSTLVGKKSFGKGSVQQLEELSDGSSLKITIARWLTPKGNSINEKGIEPDIEVELTKEDFENNRDPQLERAIEELKNQIGQ